MRVRSLGQGCAARFGRADLDLRQRQAVHQGLVPEAVSQGLAHGFREGVPVRYGGYESGVRRRSRVWNLP